MILPVVYVKKKWNKRWERNVIWEYFYVECAWERQEHTRFQMNWQTTQHNKEYNKRFFIVVKMLAWYNDRKEEFMNSYFMRQTEEIIT